MNLQDLIKSEGDFYEWTSKSGCQCFIARNSTLLTWCGYVSLTPDNILYGRDYDDIDVEVHGGLTFGEKDSDNNWVFGFDCAHSGDLVPYFNISTYGFYETSGVIYRDREYVISQTNYLDDQLSDYSKSTIRNGKISDILK